MQREHALSLLRNLLVEVQLPNGQAATEKFLSLREVDSKVREARQILEAVGTLPKSLLTDLTSDLNFEANSRRVRLETLAGHLKTAIRFLESGAFETPKKAIISAPDVTRLTSNVPNLDVSIKRRWDEAQKCVHAGCFTAAVIMMGSVLEALLLARANLSPTAAYSCTRAPKDKNGKSVAIHEWNLATLIDVSVEVGWLKTDRGKFSHALRESRNVVHPWQEVMSRANFDLATCKTSWEVLNASVDDLLQSI